MCKATTQQTHLLARKLRSGVCWHQEQLDLGPNAIGQLVSLEISLGQFQSKSGTEFLSPGPGHVPIYRAVAAAWAG